MALISLLKLLKEQQDTTTFPSMKGVRLKRRVLDKRSGIKEEGRKE